MSVLLWFALLGAVIAGAVVGWLWLWLTAAILLAIYTVMFWIAVTAALAMKKEVERTISNFGRGLPVRPRRVVGQRLR